MKESKLIEMSNKVDTVGMALNRVVQELGNLKDLSIGLAELVKLMPGYDEGLDKMKENLKKEQDKEETKATKETAAKKRNKARAVRKVRGNVYPPYRTYLQSCDRV